MCNCVYQQSKDREGIDAKITGNTLEVTIRYENYHNIQHIEIDSVVRKLPISFCPFCGLDVGK